MMETTNPPGEVDHSACLRFQNAIELIGRRWTGAIIFVLMQGPANFSEILPRVPELRDRLLSERLKELEDAGIVTREVLPLRPPSVRYALTEKGRALAPVLESITEWIDGWPEKASSQTD